MCSKRFQYQILNQLDRLHMFSQLSMNNLEATLNSTWYSTLYVPINTVHCSTKQCLLMHSAIENSLLPDRTIEVKQTW